MVRFCTKQILRFVAAVVLLALSLCAVEVALRVQKLRGQFCSTGTSGAADLALVEPSRTTYLDVPSLVDMTTRSDDGQLDFRTNAWGLRGKEVIVPKPRGMYRALCLGNSETLAPEIHEQATFVSGLQSKLQSVSSLPVEVLNAGCPDAGPIVNMLRGQRLLGLQPDLLILVLSPDDINRDADVRRFLRLDEEGFPSHACHPRMREGESMIDEVCREFYTAEWLAETAGQQILKGTKTSSTQRIKDSSPGSLPQEFDERLVELPFLHTAQMAERIYARCLIVVYPTPWDLAREKKLVQPDPRSPHAILQQIAAANSLPLCDLFRDFQQAPNLRTLYSSETGRLTTEGHLLIADRVSQFILNQIPGTWGPVQEPQSRPVPEIGQWP